MGYISGVFFLFLIGFLMIGSQIAQVDIKNNIERDIYNYTESTINLEPINISYTHPIEKTKGVINEGRMYLIIESFINFLLISAEQVVKMGIEFGYQNHDINYHLIFRYLVYILISILIIYLIKPIGFILIGIIMFGILIKEKIDKRKRRKREWQHGKQT